MKAALILVFGSLARPGHTLSDAAPLSGSVNSPHLIPLSTMGIAAVLLAVIAISVLTACLDRRGRKHSLQLKFADERDRAFFHRDSAAIFRATLDGDLIDMNEACARLLGHSSRSRALAEGLGKNIVDFDEYTIFLAELDSDGTVTARELQFRRVDASIVYVLCHASAMRSTRTGEVIVQATLMDITERKRLEALSAQRDAAEAASVRGNGRVCSADRLQILSRSRTPGLGTFVMPPVWKMDLEKTMVTALENSSRTPFTDSLEDRNGHLPGHQKFTILLAEDNVINQKVAARLLEKQGHTVTVANNGSEAVTAMFRESFDIVLMDVQMPEMSGLEATRLFREYEKTSSRRQLIVAVTAYALPGDREKCLEAGMDEYISKPFNVHELCALLNHIVAARTVQA